MTSERILLTGATGHMGAATLNALLARQQDRVVRCLVLSGEIKHPVVLAHADDKRVEIVFGDLRNADDVLSAVSGCDLVLHIGALVSPAADHLPEALTTAVNVGGTANVVNAIKAQPDPDSVRLIYIGSVAQTGHRPSPIHWGRTGDPIKISRFDHYARTKTEAEALVAESGLTYWASLRQTGIAYPEMWKIFDPIIFHSPFNDVFEWVTVQDAGRLMACIAFDDTPDHFWRRFYNIGGGEQMRVMNHQFAAAASPGDFRKTMDVRWSARRNFHGQWYSDSDDLAAIFDFRRQTMIDVAAMMRGSLPKIAKIVSRLAPGLVLKRIKGLAEAPGGPLYWERTNDREHLDAFFGPGLSPSRLPDWSGFPLEQASRRPITLDHGFGDLEPTSLGGTDLREAAAFRGVKAEGSITGAYEPSAWRCTYGHGFTMSPNLMFAGGHWCPQCMYDPRAYAPNRGSNRFFAQVCD